MKPLIFMGVLGLTSCGEIASVGVDMGVQPSDIADLQQALDEAMKAILELRQQNDELMEQCYGGET